MFDHTEVLEPAKRINPMLVDKVREAVEAALEQGLSFDEFVASTAVLIGHAAATCRRDHG